MSLGVSRSASDSMRGINILLRGSRARGSTFKEPSCIYIYYICRHTYIHR